MHIYIMCVYISVCAYIYVCVYKCVSTHVCIHMHVCILYIFLRKHYWVNLHTSNACQATST